MMKTITNYEVKNEIYDLIEEEIFWRKADVLKTPKIDIIRLAKDGINNLADIKRRMFANAI